MIQPIDAERLTHLDHTCLWHPFTQQKQWAEEAPLIVQSGDGVWLEDIQGRRYIDGVSSLWTNVHGHNHPVLNQALTDQLHQVAHSTLLGLSHPPAIELAARLIELVPHGLQRVFYSDNGSTAVEVALKMAFQYHQQVGNTGRTRFACLRDAYHGDTIGAVSVGAIDLFHSLYRPLLFDALILEAPLSEADEHELLEANLALLEAHAHELAAFVFEPLVQGAAGMKMHSPEFIHTLANRARELGVLLIADEVAVGFGRTGTLFAVEQAGIQPDFLCLAKGLSAGYLPLSATVTTEQVYSAFLGEADAYKQFFHGHTFTGNPLACAVSLANLDLFEDNNIVGHVRDLAVLIRNQLEVIAEEPDVVAVRQRGVMVGIDVGDATGAPLPGGLRQGHRVCMKARELGAILRPLGDTVVLNPPLSITLEEMKQLLDITLEAIRAERR